MRVQKLASVFLGVLFLLGAGVLLASAADNPQEKQEKPVKEEFTAWAINLDGAVKSGQVLITIDRWSTPEERNKLIETFTAGGQDALFKALTKMPSVGYIRVPRTTAWELHYAYQWPHEDGGRTVVIATDRRVGFQEVRYNGRSMDYPFELIQMKLDAEGKGEGRLSWATKIYVTKDGKSVAFENYDTAPVVLQNIQTKIKKPKEPAK